MEITVTIPPSVEDHLKAYAASLFFETTPYAISRAIVSALVNQLDAARLVSRDEIVTGILEESKQPAPKPLSTPVIEKEVVALPVEKANATLSAPLSTDPKRLKVPGERFQGKASNTWLVWGWSMAASLNLATLENGVHKFQSFNLQDVLQGVLRKKGIPIKSTTAYSALNVMVTREWLTFNSTSKHYILSSAAQKWILTSKNQSYLIKKGFLDPIVQTEPAV